MHYIIIRESQPKDLPAITDVVRNAYISNVTPTYWSTLLNEITFQSIVLLAAFMFIFLGVHIVYCLSAVPIVLVLIYLSIYGALLMKATELTCGKRPLKCWVAEVYEPPFLLVGASPPCAYKIVTEEQLVVEAVNVNSLQRKIIGSVAVMKHRHSEDWAWMFRLCVDQSYRKKGVGRELVKASQSWCRQNKFNYIELVMSEHQEEARSLFTNTGFQTKQMYSKRFLVGAYLMQMFHLRCEVRSTFQ